MLRNRRRILLGTLGALLAFSFRVEMTAAQSLEDTLVAVYSGNPTLLGGRAQLRAVNERVPQELANWRPSVRLRGSLGIQSVDDSRFAGGFESSKPREIELEVRQFLYRGGRTIAGTQRAEAEVGAERARLSAIERDVLLGAVSAYMDVWRDQAVLDLTRNNEQVLARQLEATEIRFEVGEVTLTDVAQSESRFSRAVAARIDAEGNLETSRAVYEQLVGFAPGQLSEPRVEVALPSNDQGVVASALADNPDVAVASFDEEAANHGVREALGEFLPSVSLSASLSHINETTARTEETNSARVLASVEIPIYQQGAASSRLREAKQVSSQRRIAIEEARRLSRQRAIDSWESLQSARAQIVSFEAQVRAAEIALDGVRQESEVGARTVLDILDAEQELLDASVSLVRAKRDEVVARFAVLAAMGRLSASNLGLPVETYDPEVDYQAVRSKWIGLSAPGVEE